MTHRPVPHFPGSGPNPGADLHIGPNAEEVDSTRMHLERLARAQASLRRNGIDAALLFNPLNVRYVGFPLGATVLSFHMTFAWILVPAEGRPVLWAPTWYLAANHPPGYFSGEVRDARHFNFFGDGTNACDKVAMFASEIATVVDDLGLTGSAIGVDQFDASAYLALTAAGLRISEAHHALEEARSVKTVDELTIMRQNALLTDRALEKMRSVIRPGVTENELWGTFIGEAFKEGAEWLNCRWLASGPRTNPWLHEASDRVVEAGELVGIDTDLCGRSGYLTDISRTYLCGEGPATDEQRRLYQTAFDFVHGNIPDMRAGASMQELGRRLAARLPAEFYARRYPFIAHGCGMCDEYPCVKWDNHHDGELEPGMVMSVEAYIGAEGGSQGVKLEEQIIITDGAPELISHAPHDERLLQ